ncbi:MAG: hypothetical protein AAGJ10_03180 [Bacteroidota bacterium]
MRYATLLIILAFPLSICAQSSSLAPRLGVVIPPDAVLTPDAAPDTSVTAWLERYMERLQERTPDASMPGAEPLAIMPDAVEWMQEEIRPRIQWLRPGPDVDPKMWLKAPDNVDPKMLLGIPMLRGPYGQR